MSESSSVSPPPDWERLRNLARRAIAPGPVSFGSLEQLARGIPSLLEYTESLEAQLQEATRTLDAIREWAEKLQAAESVWWGNSDDDGNEQRLHDLIAAVASLLGEQKEAGS